MVKRKMKKAIKQKQKQNVNVKQNVKVVVGDALGILRSKEIKKKRAIKSSGAKSGAGAKPPIILNISQPHSTAMPSWAQPYNNPYMEYFKNQLQNKEPVKANTLAQYEKLNEREENKASKVGLLHNLDKEPDDVARELRREKVAGIARYQVAQAEQKSEAEQVRIRLKPVSQRKIHSTPLRPRNLTPRENLMASIRANVPETPAYNQVSENQVLRELSNQTSQLEQMIANPYEALDDEETRAEFPASTSSVNYSRPGGPGGAGTEPVAAAKKGPGRPKKTQEEKDETARLKAERKQMEKNDPYEKAIAKAKRQANKIRKQREESMAMEEEN